jgi:hypothetical protein
VGPQDGEPLGSQGAEEVDQAIGELVGVLDDERRCSSRSAAEPNNAPPLAWMRMTFCSSRVSSSQVAARAARPSLAERDSAAPPRSEATRDADATSCLVLCRRRLHRAVREMALED